MKKLITLLTIALIIICAMPLVMKSASETNNAIVTLAWNASPSTNVTGYKLYWGVASRQYTNTYNVGAPLTGSISNLIRGETYFFAATAYTSNSIESEFSEELSYTIPLSGNISLWIP